MEINEALAKLDVEDDGQWTGNGLPLLDELEKLLGRKVSRKEVTEAAPEFSRENPKLPGQDPEPQDDEAKPEEVVEADGSEEEALSELSDAEIEFAAAQKRLDEARAEADKYARSTERTPAENQKEISKFIRSQNEERARRAEQRRIILQGLDPTDPAFDPRSKLDQAMARRPKRGQERPTRKAQE